MIWIDNSLRKSKQTAIKPMETSWTFLATWVMPVLGGERRIHQRQRRDRKGYYKIVVEKGRSIHGEKTIMTPTVSVKLLNAVTKHLAEATWGLAPGDSPSL